ncbi:MAG: hypothetical protein AAF682_23070 [Planctomycetota bacterium]
MKKIRTSCAVLLALPLIVFGGNYFVQLFALPDAGESAGEQLLQSMRDGGLMTFIAASHVAVGFLLLVPRLRFAGALLQLPISLGIVAFHGSMLPEGLGVAIFLLVLNLGALADAKRIARLLERDE